jgi:hypothetical protein
VLFFFDRDTDHEEIYTEGRDGDKVDNFGSTGVNARGGNNCQESTTVRRLLLSGGNNCQETTTVRRLQLAWDNNFRRLHMSGGKNWQEETTASSLQLSGGKNCREATTVRRLQLSRGYNC